MKSGGKGAEMTMNLLLSWASSSRGLKMVILGFLGPDCQVSLSTEFVERAQLQPSPLQSEIGRQC